MAWLNTRPFSSLHMRFTQFVQLLERVSPNHYYKVVKSFKAQRMNGDEFDVKVDDELHYLNGGTFIIRGDRLVKVKLEQPAADTVQHLIDRKFVDEIGKRDAQLVNYVKTT